MLYSVGTLSLNYSIGGNHRLCGAIFDVSVLRRCDPIVLLIGIQLGLAGLCTFCEVTINLRY